MKALRRITVELFILALVVYIATQFYYSNFADRTAPGCACHSGKRLAYRYHGKKPPAQPEVLRMCAR